MKLKSLLFVSFFSYLFFLVITLPAKPILDFISENNENVQIKGVSGSLWQGHVNEMVIDSQYSLSNLNWNSQLWRILTGELAALISAEFRQQPLSLEIGLSITGNVIARQLQAKISAADIAELGKIPLVELSGSIIANLESLSWKPGEMPSAKGNIIWKQAIVSVAESVDLGDIAIALNEGTTANSTMNATINNQGGEINVNGTADLTSNANYIVDLLLTPSETISTDISNSLSMFSQKQDNGAYRLQSEGELSMLGSL